MSRQDAGLGRRAEAAGLPGWLVERLRAGASPGMERAAARWISDLEAAQARGEELARRLQGGAEGEDGAAPGQGDVLAVQEGIRRRLGRRAARRLGPADPAGALAVLDDTEAPLSRPAPRSRAHQRVFDLAALEGSLGVLPALSPEEHEALQATRTPGEAMTVIIGAARRVRATARRAREVAAGGGVGEEP